VEWIERQRLLDVMGRRHEVDVLVLEAPAGAGRTVLIEQTLAAGPRRPRDLDRVVRPPPGADATLTARAVVEALGGPPGAAPSVSAGDGSLDGALESSGRAAIDAAVDACVEALTTAARGGREVALVVDDVDRLAPSGGELLGRLVDRLPPGGHLVLSGRLLPPMGLGRRVAGGRALVLGTDALRFSAEELARLGERAPALVVADPAVVEWPALAGLEAAGHPELMADFLAEAVLETEDEETARLLAALAAVGRCPDDVVPAVWDVVDPDGSGSAGHRDDREVRAVLARLRRLPLVAGRTEMRVHPLWADATRDRLDGGTRTRVVVAVCRTLVGRRAIPEAGELATRAGIPDALAVVVRAALSTQPAGAALPDLRRWAESGVLGPDGTERAWLDASIRLQLGDRDPRGDLGLERVRAAYEAAGDVEGEVGALLHLGNRARARSDMGAMVRLLERGRALADHGAPEARGLLALGEAVALQLADDPEGALRALESVPPGALTGEWASQLQMIRGANLMLAGRSDAAVASLEVATGEGSDATRAVAHDLLALARWMADDPVRALFDAQEAERLGRVAGSPAVVRRARATAAYGLALAGNRGRLEPLLALLRQGDGTVDDEATTLVALAEAVLMVDDGDVASARALIAATPAAARTARSSVWKAALAACLEDPPDPGEPVREAPLQNGGLPAAVAAGRLAARRRAGGPPAPAWCRRYVPARWCAPGRPVVGLAVLGVGTVERDLDPVDHPAWGRTRVRELCLHLAVVDDRDRAGVAADLWPERTDRAARQNLRVTLAHLLDVLDPERTGIPAVVDDGRGGFAFRRDGGLVVDLWDVIREAEAVLATAEQDRATLLAHARALLSRGSGPVLGGQPLGEWFTPHQRRLDDLVLGAAHRAAVVALGAGDADLVEALARRALEIDPWSERSARLVVEARLVGGDPDGARRALDELVAMVGELGIPPTAETADLMGRIAHRSERTVPVAARSGAPGGAG
jgi:DNA-binding SARP family transcriptional activator